MDGWMGVFMWITSIKPPPQCNPLAMYCPLLHVYIRVVQCKECILASVLFTVCAARDETVNWRVLACFLLHKYTARCVTR